MAFFEAAGDDTRIRVRLTPSAGRDQILGLQEDAQGQVALKASVTAVPENGKANQALIKMLAKAWKLPKSRIAVLQGQTSRNKVLTIADDGVIVREVLSRWATDKGLTS